MISSNESSHLRLAAILFLALFFIAELPAQIRFDLLEPVDVNYKKLMRMSRDQGQPVVAIL